MPRDYQANKKTRADSVIIAVPLWGDRKAARAQDRISAGSF